jgi:hypothetical protein
LGQKQGSRRSDRAHGIRGIRSCAALSGVASRDARHLEGSGRMGRTRSSHRDAMGGDLESEAADTRASAMALRAEDRLVSRSDPPGFGRGTTKPDRDAQHCFSCVWEGYGGIHEHFPKARRLHHPHRGYLLATAPLPAISDGLLKGAGARGIGPNIWWPADRTWCVATEIDYRWTYVGGGVGCI